MRNPSTQQQQQQQQQTIIEAITSGKSQEQTAQALDITRSAL
jgi:hypothetical protein